MPLPCLLPKSDRTFRLIHPLFDGDHFKAGCLLWLLTTLRRIRTYSMPISPPPRLFCFCFFPRRVFDDAVKVVS